MKATKTEVADAIFRSVQANAKAIDACDGPHDFKREDGSTLRCVKCGGLASALSVHWYKAGLKHGARDAN